MKQTIRLPDSIAPDTVTWLQLIGAPVSDREYWEAIEWERREQWKRFMFDEEFLGYTFSESAETQQATQKINTTPTTAPKTEKRVQYRKTSWFGSIQQPGFHCRYSNVNSPLELLAFTLADVLMASRIGRSIPTGIAAPKPPMQGVAKTSNADSFRLILNNADDIKPLRYYEPPERGTALSINERYYHQRFNDNGIQIAFAGIHDSDFMLGLFAAAHRLPDITGVIYSIQHDEVFDRHRITIRTTMPDGLPTAEKRTIRRMLRKLSEFLEEEGIRMLQSAMLEYPLSLEAERLPATLIPFPTPIVDSDGSGHRHETHTWE